ncbi:hypothetical protein D5b_00418 [Faustovirus]|nr:hypothetical protein D5b_00418 [Faustovirus]AMN84498.1 hypothetical protein D6_00087 [Faustovirus]AMP44360.1 hypothetical protein PRJ_Dakar_00409 [Faustovirus]QKE50194.1 hypothetical protein F-VV10_0074 [Faustovirus]
MSKLVEDFSGLPAQMKRPVIEGSTVDPENGIFTETNIRPNSVIVAGVGIRMKPDMSAATETGLCIDTMVINDPMCAYIRDNVVVKKLTYAETHEFFALRRLPRVGQAHNCKFVFRKNDDGSESDIVDLIATDLPIRKGTELCVDYGFPYYARLFIVKRLFDMKYNITNWSPQE